MDPSTWYLLGLICAFRHTSLDYMTSLSLTYLSLFAGLIPAALLYPFYIVLSTPFWLED